jgi:hypothetical protein
MSGGVRFVYIEFDSWEYVDTGLSGDGGDTLLSSGRLEAPGVRCEDEARPVPAVGEAGMIKEGR